MLVIVTVVINYFFVIPLIDKMDSISNHKDNNSFRVDSVDNSGIESALESLSLVCIISAEMEFFIF